MKSYVGFSTAISMPARAPKIIYISLDPLGPILFRPYDSTCIVTSHKVHKRHSDPQLRRRSSVQLIVEDGFLRTGVNEGLRARQESLLPTNTCPPRKSLIKSSGFAARDVRQGYALPSAIKKIFRGCAPGSAFGLGSFGAKPEPRA